MISLRNGLVGKYEYIDPSDPALDRTAEGFAAWLADSTRGPAPILPGQQPTVFVLTHLTGPAYVAAQDALLNYEAQPATTACRLVELALVDVRNLLSEDGTPVKVVRSAGADGIQRADAIFVAALYRSAPHVITSLALQITIKERPPSP